MLEAFAGEPAVQLDVFQSRSTGTAADRDIAARSWDLEGLDRAYGELLETYRPRLAAYRSGELQGARALVERMTLVHDYRRFPFRDPDLPPELLPEGWCGRLAHEVFLEAHGLLRAPAEACVDALVRVGGDAGRGGRLAPRRPDTFHNLDGRRCFVVVGAAPPCRRCCSSTRSVVLVS